MSLQRLVFENRLTTGNLATMAVLLFGFGAAYAEYTSKIENHGGRITKLEAAQDIENKHRDDLKEKLVEIRIQQAVAQSELQAIKQRVEESGRSVDSLREVIRRASEPGRQQQPVPPR